MWIHVFTQNIEQAVIKALLSVLFHALLINLIAANVLIKQKWVNGSNLLTSLLPPTEALEKGVRNFSKLTIKTAEDVIDLLLT